MKRTILHEHFATAHKATQDALDGLEDGRLITLIGLPGSGKTTLRLNVFRKFAGDPGSWGGSVPILEVLAVPDLNSRFSSKAFAFRAHHCSLSPNFDWLLRDKDPDFSEKFKADNEHILAAYRSLTVSSRIPEHEYWRQFQLNCVDRKVKIFSVEHAHALCRTKTGEDPRTHAELIIGLIEGIGIKGFFTCTPEGYGMWEGRSEVSERMKRIYLRPYDIKSQIELNQYAAMLLDVANEIGLDDTTALKNLSVEIAIATGTAMRSLEELLKRIKDFSQSRGGGKVLEEDILAAFPGSNDVIETQKLVALMHRLSKPATVKQIHAAFALHANGKAETAK